MSRSDPELLRRAAALHAAIRVLDGHVDLPADLDAAALSGDSGTQSQFDLAKARAGGLDGAVLTIHASAMRDDAPAGRAELDTRYRLITELAARNPGQVDIARSPTEFRQHSDAGRLAVVLGFQNAAPFTGGLTELDTWIDRGVSIFAFTFIGSNHWADSARPYPFIFPGKNGGLSALGRDGVRRLNERGVIIDVSQLSSDAFADVLAITRAPVLASHTALRHFVPVDRNISDEELAALRDNNGLIQIVGFGPYLRQPDAAMVQQLEGLWRHYGLQITGQLADLLSVNDPATATWDDDKFWTFLHEFHVILALDKPVASTTDLADHIEYAADRIGIERVGISSDFNHAGGLSDWQHAGQTLSVTAELVRRGFSDDQIARLWSGNFLALWQRVLDSPPLHLTH
jgi:microsomal dipeptidase-like Zn-dependent dipeptidase